MSEKGFFASICGFFSSLFSSQPVQESQDSASTGNTSQQSGDGLTGVERYIRKQVENTVKPLTGVERYIRNKASAEKVTSVERYIRNKASAEKMTSVERYIRNLG